MGAGLNCVERMAVWRTLRFSVGWKPAVEITIRPWRRKSVTLISSGYQKVRGKEHLRALALVQGLAIFRPVCIEVVCLAWPVMNASTAVTAVCWRRNQSSRISLQLKVTRTIQGSRYWRWHRVQTCRFVLFLIKRGDNMLHCFGARVGPCCAS
ncbi:uncharacterized protein BCR38DRAFT_143607 [Pseudomassariella vexata]|uniref:Uncharacterized protein n=1 Tax=Pseudomassariella vexata TaxID=1141098 RepID=A0A1Y2ECF7_9PEZI|nr:uncharacterized protein BCR38DRAFT_143607 [Pseudomassariella vexata]ORY69087.1 hypothetical protein BCR38DRAFT_143607 [Pseudomassariella vexata]